MRHKVRWWDSLTMSQLRTALTLVIFSLVPAVLSVYTQSDEVQMPHQEVEHWANKIGNHLFHLSNAFAQYSEIRKNFIEADAKIQENDGLQLVKEMAADVTNMMKYKIDAVRRIMNVAEEASLDKFKEDEEVVYYNAKKVNEYYDNETPSKAGKLKEGFREIKLMKNAHFDGIPVNTNVSSVHVPTNVYDEAPEVTHAIRWSDRLDRTFKSNYELDPTLSWQYFGSSTGFLRQYPATKWDLDKKDPDLYDSRLRSWYIEAANSAKDMVILLDVSGSMTGLNREIAKHVVLNILETLNENDFVNVFNFSEDTVELVPCFNDTLVQANLENIGEFKKALSVGETKDIANFTQALTKAFELLLRYNKSGQGSQCNQAIMLVTDGAPYNFDEIFKKYNRPQLQVRVFTYLIGRQEASVRDLKWMACANKGYFVHVTTLAEVREQVLKYIPVMARPMVMYQSTHPHIWTGVYADIAHPRHGYMDPKQTDWLWEVRERQRQMDRTNNYRKLNKLSVAKTNMTDAEKKFGDPFQVENFMKYGDFYNDTEIARIVSEKARKMRPLSKRIRREVSPLRGDGNQYNTTSGNTSLNQGEHRRRKRDVCFQIPKRIHDYDLRKRIDRMYTAMENLEKYYENRRLGRREAPGLRDGYRLMTTVAVPVFDRKKTTNITERVLVNDSVWIMRTREVRSANLLGVAGTDVPIREIEKLVPPYKLGVNGYSFMVNQNGFVLYHPDLRPVFQDILKPNYNSVDFSEVELVDFDGDPRANDSELLSLTMGRDYNTKLRRNLIDQRADESEMKVKIHLDDMKRVVTRGQWYFAHRVDDTPFSLGIALPKSYGKYKVHGQIELSRAIQDPRSGRAMAHFSSGNWTLHPEWVYCEYKYDDGRHDLSPEELLTDFLSRAQKPHWKWRSTRTRPVPEPSMTHTTCDKDLIQSLLFDAKATNVYSSNNKMEDKINGENSGRHIFGITTSFVATRSGLTRWLDLTKPNQTEESHIQKGLPHFMRVNNRAIDEVWYKRAVDYYDQDPEAYVYSVPFDSSTREPNEILVTGTRAIFIVENNYRKAPAAVVGVTIKHSKFVEYFMNETYKNNNPCPSYPSRDSGCKDARTCESKSLDCYLLDDNGFIVASEKQQNTGKFFGTLEGTIMESLVQSEVYKRVKIYDYQAVCLDTEPKPNMASILLTPLAMIRWTFNWLVGNIFWVMVKTHLYTLWDPNAAWAYTHTERDVHYPVLEDPPQDAMDFKNNYEDSNVHPDDSHHPHTEDLNQSESFPELELAYINKTRPRPCDKFVNLYMLQNHKLMQEGVFKPVKGKLSNCHTNGCGRPFSVQKVKSTNLILVAVNNLCNCASNNVDVEPEEVDYNETMHCNRLLLSHFRKRSANCFNYHPEEEEIKLCGGAGSLGLPSVAMLILLVLANIFNTLKLHS